MNAFLSFMKIILLMYEIKKNLQLKVLTKFELGFYRYKLDYDTQMLNSFILHTLRNGHMLSSLKQYPMFSSLYNKEKNLLITVRKLIVHFHDSNLFALSLGMALLMIINR